MAQPASPPGALVGEAVQMIVDDGRLAGEGDGVVRSDALVQTHAANFSAHLERMAAVLDGQVIDPA